MSKAGVNKTITFSACSIPMTDLDKSPTRNTEFRPHSSSCSGRLGEADRPRKNLLGSKRSGSLSAVGQAKPPASPTTTMDENLNSLPDIRVGTENLASDDRPNGNVFTITQPVSSGRNSPSNMSFRMKNLQPDSISRDNVRPASSEESLESNGAAVRRNLTTLLSLIYAIFVVTLGCIFTSTYHGKLFNMKEYNEIFGCVVCVIGVAWLVFLHVDLTRYKLLILERIKKTLKEYEDLADRISLTTECVINGQYAWSPKAPEDENTEDLVPHYRFLKGRHSGSFFLKTGMAVFCSGHIIHEGLMLSKGIIDWNNDPENCRDVTNVLLHTLRPVFSFYQLFIVFKYSNIVINRFKEVARFGVMHLIATSLHAWFSTIVDDAVSGHGHHSDHDHHHPSNLTNHTVEPGCVGQQSPMFSSAAYLYPCTIEFNIILAGVWFVVWQNIGNIHLHSKSHHLEQKIDGPEGSHEITYESNLVISADCHAANKGLFAGILVLLTSIITVIIFFVVLHSSSFLVVGSTIYNCQEGILTALGLAASIVAYFKVVQLDQNAHPVTFLDNFLLFIPLPFYFINAILCIMAELDMFETTRIVLRVASLLQIIIQTPLLVDGLRRCSNSHVLRYQKPGREIITFLLILNVTQWVVFTVQQKHIDDLIAAKVVYGDLWAFIGHATIPVMLFYRFHSAVCLADIWQSAYFKGE
uniref:Putative secreted protein n=1 Tax=Ixodes ricinus TaxID=34613 RepID=A0A131YBU2_IXORI